MPSKTPPFHSTVLSESIKEADSTFNKYLESLDAISKDIKNLEAYLQDKGITFYHTHSTGPHIPEDKASFVTWRFCESAKKFRLFYTVMTWNDPEDEIENSGEGVAWEKPLIETEKGVRLRVFPALPEFVKSLARELEVVQGKAVSTISGKLKF